MVKRKRTASNLELVGGRLCLDFANTVSTRIGAQRREYLISYSQLVAWGQHARILTDDKTKALLHNAARRPDVALTALERAINLREAIYRIFSAIAVRLEPQRADLSVVNAALHTALSRLEVLPSPDGFEWTWVLEEDDFDRILWPVVRSAAELLTSGDLRKVRQCARDGCDWLFVDSTKNHSRRWCSMNMCGSRVKSRRYFQRKKEKRRIRRDTVVIK